MNISSLDQINNIQKTIAQGAPDALRKAATQFEALLLMQLTSVLNNTGGDADEDSLFGSDGGSGLAKQMFSEQLATTMAQSGGVGLADVILRQTGGAPALKARGEIKGLSSAMTAVKDIKSYSSSNNKSVSDSKMGYFLNIDSTPNTSEYSPSNDPGDAQVISRFEDQVRAEGIDPSLEHLVLDGRIVNTTRPRIAPNAPINAIGESSPVSSPNSSNSSYIRPVSGRISSGFGNRFHPIDKKIKFHAGMDIAVPIGTPVGAAAKGTVTFSGWNGDYGNLVIIEHPDGRVTRYGHLSKLIAQKDEAVLAGQVIALSGSTGKSTGPHVHFEVRENGQVVDPLTILSKGFPR